MGWKMAKNAISTRQKMGVDAQNTKHVFPRSSGNRDFFWRRRWLWDLTWEIGSLLGWKAMELYNEWLAYARKNGQVGSAWHISVKIYQTYLLGDTEIHDWLWLMNAWEGSKVLDHNCFRHLLPWLGMSDSRTGYPCQL
jgi:hypothetical protein